MNFLMIRYDYGLSSVAQLWERIRSEKQFDFFWSSLITVFCFFSPHKFATKCTRLSVVKQSCKFLVRVCLRYFGELVCTDLELGAARITRWLVGLYTHDAAVFSSNLCENIFSFDYKQNNNKKISMHLQSTTTGNLST